MDSLPVELVAHILGYIQLIYDVLKAIQVCRVWRHILQIQNNEFHLVRSADDWLNQISGGCDIIRKRSLIEMVMSKQIRNLADQLSKEFSIELGYCSVSLEVDDLFVDYTYTDENEDRYQLSFYEGGEKLHLGWRIQSAAGHFSSDFHVLISMTFEEFAAKTVSEITRHHKLHSHRSKIAALCESIRPVFPKLIARLISLWHLV